MSSPYFSFSNANVVLGRTPEVLDKSTSGVFQILIRKFGDQIAAFLASHVGIEDDELDWEGVRPLGQGNFGAVGLWVGKDKNGTNVKVRITTPLSLPRLTIPGNRYQTMQLDGSGKAESRSMESSRSLDHETAKSITLSQYSAARKLQDLSCR